MIDMAIPTEHIRSAALDYLEAHPGDRDALSGLLQLLEDGAELASRKEFRGHATAGAVLLNADGQVLHIHHLALGKWLLPGGHLEEQDATLQEAALRELTEETGIDPASVAPVDVLPVHVDVHPIPASESKGEPAHQHVDFRYCFTTEAREPLRLQEEEVSGYAWRPIDSITDENLRERVRAIRREVLVS